MTRLARALPAALIAVLLACAAAITGGIGTTRAETELAVDVDLGVVLPGQTVTREHRIDVPERATTVRSEWVRVEGLATQLDWDIQICGAGGCEDVDPPRTGAEFAPGSYTMTITATLPDSVSPGSGRALGVITLQSGDPLPATGAELSWTLVALAGGALTAGIVAVFAARPRRTPRSTS